jgi:hypothetical protein
MAITAGLMGVASHIGANVHYNDIKNNVLASTHFEEHVQAENSKLMEELLNEKIAYEDYISSYKALKEKPAILEYAKNSDDEILHQNYVLHEEAKDMANTLYKKGIPALGAMTAIGAVAFGTTEYFRRKYDAMMEDYKLAHGEMETSK